MKMQPLNIMQMKTLFLEIMMVSNSATDNCASDVLSLIVPQLESLLLEVLRVNHAIELSATVEFDAEIFTVAHYAIEISYIANAGSC